MQCSKINALVYFVLKHKLFITHNHLFIFIFIIKNPALLWVVRNTHKKSFFFKQQDVVRRLVSFLELHLLTTSAPDTDDFVWTPSSQNSSTVTNEAFGTLFSFQCLRQNRIFQGTGFLSLQYCIP